MASWGWADGVGCQRIKRCDLILDRTLSEMARGKNSAILTLRAFARKIKSPSVTRLRVTSICARPLRLSFQPIESSFVDRSPCVQPRHLRRTCNCGPTTFRFLGVFICNYIFGEAVAVHFKRRPRLSLIIFKRKGKVLRLEQAGRGVRRWNGEPERSAVAKAASL